MPEAGSRWQIGKLGRLNWAVAGMASASRFLFHVAKCATVVELLAEGRK